MVAWALGPFVPVVEPMRKPGVVGAPAEFWGGWGGCYREENGLGNLLAYDGVAENGCWVSEHGLRYCFCCNEPGEVLWQARRIWAVCRLTGELEGVPRLNDYWCDVHSCNFWWAVDSADSRSRVKALRVYLQKSQPVSLKQGARKRKSREQGVRPARTDCSGGTDTGL